MKYRVGYGDEERWIERIPAGLRTPEGDIEAELHWLGADEVAVTLDGRTYRAFARRIEGGWLVQLRGWTFEIEVEDERAHAIRTLTGDAAGGAGARELRAPMPGLVVSILVEPGQRVEPGEGLVIVEAMKMENELKAETAGTVAAISVKPGEAVDRDAVLVRFEATDS
ncbi:MAG: biotin/lipoyl-binding protein [Gemmatimonadetes bacterium]|nr:biotin/lipoyl-binding protein [Gemmatimonadota bacterium]